MIEIVASIYDAPEPQENTPASAETEPVVFVPVTAEDAARRQRRTRLAVWGVVIVLLLAAGYVYKRIVDPIHARQAYESGMRLFQVSRYAQAALAFEQAAALQANFTDAILMRGRANYYDGKIDRALQDFNRVLEVQPDNTTALLGRGRAYLDLKDYHSALADANRALDINSRLAPAYNLRALATRRLGDLQKALEDLNRAVALSPDTDDYFQRGATYQMLGDHRRALEDFNHVIELQPDAANGYFARAESRRALGDISGAASDHRQGRILDGR